MDPFFVEKFSLNRYLHASGADITADNNYAIKWASQMVI
jgi:hypothetical protein